MLIVSINTRIILLSIADLPRSQRNKTSLKILRKKLNNATEYLSYLSIDSLFIPRSEKKWVETIGFSSFLRIECNG